MNLVVAIDDLHPERGWGCEGDVQVDYLKSLNDEFEIGRAHVRTPVTRGSRMPSSA